MEVKAEGSSLSHILLVPPMILSPTIELTLTVTESLVGQPPPLAWG